MDGRADERTLHTTMSQQNVCTRTTTGNTVCTDCTGQPGIPFVAPHIVSLPVLAWDTGAVTGNLDHSVKTLTGSIRIGDYSVGPSAGIVLGLGPPPRVVVQDPTNLTHAWYTTTLNNVLLAQPVEHGTPLGDPIAITSASLLEVRRIGSRISYRIDGADVVWSPTPSYGALLGGVAQYGSGDKVRGDIVFETLDVPDMAASGRAAIRLRALGLEVLDGGRAGVRLSARGFARGEARGHVALHLIARGGEAEDGGRARLSSMLVYGRGFGLLPDVGVGIATMTPTLVYAETFSADFDAGATDIRLRARGSNAANVGLVRMPPVRASGDDVMPPDGDMMLLFQGHGWMSATAGFQRSLLSDVLALSGAPLPKAIDRLIERLALADGPMSVLQASAALRDAVDFVDRIAVVWRLLLVDTLVLDAAAVPSLSAAAELVDSLALVGGPGSSLSARNLVAETLGMADTLAVLAKEALGDTAVFGAVLTSHIRQRVAALDALLLDAIAAGGARISAVVEDTLRLGDTPASTAEMLAHLRETVGFAVSIRLGDDLYLAWVVNTETRAATQYENFPFNSFAELGGRYFAAADDGIYLLGGEDDDGEAIRARLRIGLSNLGTGKEKRMPAMYWGYRADGDLVLKVVTTEPSGEKVENWYALRPRGAGDMREGRVQIGRGLKSVYWDFEVANIDGADFELDSLELFPMILDRRVRGRDG